MTAPNPSLGIFGRGRLAQAVARAARADDAPPAWMVGRDERPEQRVDVAVEASVADAVAGRLEWAAEHGVHMVVATTGWDDDLSGTDLGSRIGIVIAPNGSLTVALLKHLARLLGAFGRLHYGDSADGYLLDYHHAAKVDAPSGTARHLAAAWREGAGRDPDIASLRAGHEVGTHVIGLDAPGEQLEITHRARSRATFAHGLLTAARWVVGRRGLFTMDDVARDLFAGSSLDSLFTESPSTPSRDRLHP